MTSSTLSELGHCLRFDGLRRPMLAVDTGDAKRKRAVCMKNMVPSELPLLKKHSLRENREEESVHELAQPCLRTLNALAMDCLNDDESIRDMKNESMLFTSMSYIFNARQRLISYDWSMPIRE